MNDTPATEPSALPPDNGLGPGRSHAVPDLVDTIAQILFAASLISEALPATYQRSHAQGRHGLDELHRLIRGALGETYSLKRALRPQPPPSRTPAEILNHLVTALGDRVSIQAMASSNCLCEIPAEVHSALYRIAYEALHALSFAAPGAHLALDLRCRPDLVTLRIIGDDAGLDPAAVKVARAELARIGMRAAAYGATLEHALTPPQGTWVQLRWPLPPDGASLGMPL